MYPWPNFICDSVVQVMIWVSNRAPFIDYFAETLWEIPPSFYIPQQNAFRPMYLLFNNLLDIKLDPDIRSVHRQSYLYAAFFIISLSCSRTSSWMHNAGMKMLIKVFYIGGLVTPTCVSEMGRHCPSRFKHHRRQAITQINIEQLWIECVWINC